MDSPFLFHGWAATALRTSFSRAFVSPTLNRGPITTSPLDRDRLLVIRVSVDSVHSFRVTPPRLDRGDMSRVPLPGFLRVAIPSCPTALSTTRHYAVIPALVLALPYSSIHAPASGLMHDACTLPIDYTQELSAYSALSRHDIC